MKAGVLFSGGKDSTYALRLARKCLNVRCLISIISSNEESYMFHTPNIEITRLQAESMGIPLISRKTAGVRERELADLRSAIREARKRYGIEAVVTGAVESVYQATRIQKICDDLGLWCMNPLWKMDQVELLKDVVKSRFDVMITGIFAYPLDRKWLGRKINRRVISELVGLRDRYQVSPSGEGGEIETTVLDAPFFRKRIAIVESEVSASGNSGVMRIKRAELVRK